MSEFISIKPLKYWVQKVLPLVYDDSLSYYELLSKVVLKLNELIINNQNLPDYIEQEIARQITPEHIEEILSEIFEDLRHNIAIADEGDSSTATADRTTGEWVWLDDELYVVVRDMNVGDAYVSTGTNPNVTKTTVEEQVKALIGTFQDQIDDISGDLSAEVTAREDADTLLTNNLNDEITNRESADTAIINSINTIKDETLYIYPEDYGAVGDGTTDDTVAIQDCLDDNLGKIVVFRKTYNVTGALTVSSGSYLLGIDGSKIIDNATLANNLDGIFMCANGKDIIFDNINVEGSNIDGSVFYADNDVKCIFAFDTCENVVVKNCEIIGVSKAFAIMFRASEHIRVDNCHLKYYSYVGIGGYDTTKDFIVSNCKVELSRFKPSLGGNQYAIVLSGYHSTTYIAGSHLKALNNICISDNPMWEGIDAHGGSDIEVAGNYVEGFKTGIAMVSSPSGTPLFVCNNTNVHDNCIIGTQLEGTSPYPYGSSGIGISGYNAKVTNNTCVECGRSYSASDSVESCSAIGASSVLSQAIISDNILLYCGGCGISLLVDSSLNNVYIARNIINIQKAIGDAMYHVYMYNASTVLNIEVSDNSFVNYAPKFRIPSVPKGRIVFKNNYYPNDPPSYDNIGNCKPDMCSTAQIAGITVGNIGDTILCTNDNTIAMWICTKSAPSPVYKKILATA